MGFVIAPALEAPENNSTIHIKTSVAMNIPPQGPFNVTGGRHPYTYYIEPNVAG